MDRFEKHAEYIMERGDRILAEKANKAKMIKRFSLSGAGIIAAAIVGIFTLHSAPSAPERIPVVSEVISTTSGYASDTVTTVPATAQTKAAKTTVATTPTTVKAKELTANISRSEMTAADTTSQATQTIIVVSAERVTESSHSAPTSTSQSSTATVTRSEPFKSLPMSGTASDTTTSEITTEHGSPSKGGDIILCSSIEWNGFTYYDNDLANVSAYTQDRYIGKVSDFVGVYSTDFKYRVSPTDNVYTVKETYDVLFVVKADLNSPYGDIIVMCNSDWSIKKYESDLLTPEHNEAHEESTNTNL